MATLRRSRPNVVITGFMGTGKSTVAPLVADALGRELVDTDALIAEGARMSIPNIFAQLGEAAFRQLEAHVCARLATFDDVVIATGGGTLLQAANLEALARRGLVVCLTASEAAIAARLPSADAERPLAAHWRTLLQQRQAAYAALPHHIDTTDKTPQQVAQEVVRLWASTST